MRKAKRYLRAVAGVLALLAGGALGLPAQTTVQVPYTGSQSVTVNYSGSTPVSVTITGLPSGCTQGQSSLSNGVITVLVNCGGTPPPPPPPPPPTTCAKSVSPSGGTDNATLNAAIALAAGKCVELTAGTYKLSAWTPPSGTNLACDDGVTVDDTPGFSSNAALFNVSAQNITIQAVGPNHSCGFTMPNTYKTNSTSSQDLEWNPCIYIATGAKNIVLRGFWIKNCGGDGITFNGGSSIVVDSIDSGFNWRQGAAITTGSGTVLDSVSFTNSSLHDNHNSGMDFEPNGIPPNNTPGTAQVTNFTYNNINTYNNPGGGTSFGFYAVGTGGKISINANNVTSTNDKQYSFFFANTNSGQDVNGTVVCNNCTSVNAGFGGAYGRKSGNTGWQMVFNNLTVTNSNRSGNDPHYAMNSSIGVGLTGGSPAGAVAGGVAFNNVKITGGNGCTQVSGAITTTVSGTCNGAAVKFP